MRVLLAATVVLFVLGLICLAVPTTIAGANWPTWLMGGLTAWALDVFLGGYVWAVPGPRQQ